MEKDQNSRTAPFGGSRLWRLIAPKNISKWRRLLQRYLERPGYVALVAAISAMNSFIPFFPVELFMILRVLVRPREWVSQAVIAAVASAIAAVGLARLVNSQPHAELATWLAHRLGEASWQHVSTFVHERGSWGLALVSISFLPLPPAVVMCALSKVPDWKIAFSIGAGHCLKYGLFAWIAAYFPRLFGETEQETVSL